MDLNTHYANCAASYQGRADELATEINQRINKAYVDFKLVQTLEKHRRYWQALADGAASLSRAAQNGHGK